MKYFSLLKEILWDVFKSDCYNRVNKYELIRVSENVWYYLKGCFTPSWHCLEPYFVSMLKTSMVKLSIKNYVCT